MTTTASGARRTPLHEQVYLELRDQISSGHISEGEQLPPELELATQYGVSRGTMRQAIARLADDGIVERTAGRGTFVSSQRLVFAARELLGFSTQIRESGRVPSSQVVDVSVLSASEASTEHSIATAPEATPAGLFGAQVAEVISIERVREADGEPIALERLMLPFPRFAGLRDIDLEEQSIYDTLENVFGVQLTVGEFSLDITDLASREAELLHEPEQRSAFVMSGVVLDQNNIPVVSVRSMYRRDKFSFTFTTPRGGQASMQYTQPRLVVQPTAGE